MELSLKPSPQIKLFIIKATQEPRYCADVCLVAKRKAAGLLFCILDDNGRHGILLDMMLTLLPASIS
jgi:hypothetical protein